MFDFQEELRKLPDQPGVYIMHDKTDAIIYIGKAVSLRKRVRQYFQPSHDEGIKKKQMVEHIARFEYIIKNSGKFKTTISYKTIYNYIDEGLFPNLSNKHLPVKKESKKRKYDEVRTAVNNKKGKA